MQKWEYLLAKVRANDIGVTLILENGLKNHSSATASRSRYLPIG